MITQLNKQRIKILASKGHDSKEIAKRTGMHEKSVRMITDPYNSKQLVGKAKVFKKHEYKVTSRPKSKHLLVREYIENTDTVYSSDMNKLGVAHISTSLTHYARHNNVKFIKLNEFSWAIER